MSYYEPPTYAACGECGAWATDERPLTGGVCSVCAHRAVIRRRVAVLVGLRHGTADADPIHLPSRYTHEDRAAYVDAWRAARRAA